ncbi:hypothetical protein FKG94_04890 [Exilibacterium tricleocarpae]|uniref:Uncharacterized protein n=1 Tax=Exilibacterium tricleocarpae TaxID=2591008 RepID=A0A545U3G9_9GAMM|nr:hypothetical protein [Exilibacterium tricleocarpae]TQV84006.1 hypothetical protein FKG94_04890 [Exilibacterium tricleocarpae]
MQKSHAFGLHRLVASHLDAEYSAYRYVVTFGMAISGTAASIAASAIVPLGQLPGDGAGVLRKRGPILLNTAVARHLLNKPGHWPSASPIAIEMIQEKI